MKSIAEVDGNLEQIEIYENGIEENLKQFCIDNDIENLKAEPQTVWNACLMYIQRQVFTNRDMLKQKKNIYTANTITATNCNSYDYELLNSICDYYIYICGLYDKECSIYGFSKLTKIDYKIIQEWGHNYSNSNRLSQASCNIYQKLTDEREQSLVAKLVSMKHPTAMAIILNKEYSYNLPGVSKEQANKGALTAADVLQLTKSENMQNAQIEVVADAQIIDKTQDMV